MYTVADVMLDDNTTGYTQLKLKTQTIHVCHFLVTECPMSQTCKCYYPLTPSFPSSSTDAPKWDRIKGGGANTMLCLAHVCQHCYRLNHQKTKTLPKSALAKCCNITRSPQFHVLLLLWYIHQHVPNLARNFHFEWAKTSQDLLEVWQITRYIP